MRSTRNVIALKQAGTAPPSEGMLARFAMIYPIHSLEDAVQVAKQHPALVLVDVRMRKPESRDVVERLRHQNSKTLIMLLDFKQPPATLRQQLNHLASLVAPHHGKPLDIGRIARILNVSQESLSRILNVSSKTAHRWMKGTRPRPKPELTRLSQIVSLMLETLPNEASVSAYLNHGNPNFGGETPMNAILRRDFDRVEADLQAVREGVYL